MSFIYNTQSGASENARLRALEIVSTNLIWINIKEEEIIKAFTGGRIDQSHSGKILVDLKQKLLKAYNQKFDKNDRKFLQMKKISS